MTMDVETPVVGPERARRCDRAGFLTAVGSHRAGRGTLRMTHPVAVLLAMLFGTAFCAVILCFVDEPVARFVVSAPFWVQRLARLITALGLSGYMIAGSAGMALAAYLLRRRPSGLPVKAGLTALFERACFVLAAVIVSGLAAQLLKHVIGRARPKLIDTLGPAHFDLFSIKASLASFPSGHATSIFALTVALYLTAPRSGRFMIVAACLVAASRVVVGSHYVSDVVAGAALGSAVALALALALARRDFAFARGSDALDLKAPGSVLPALKSLARMPRGAL